MVSIESLPWWLDILAFLGICVCVLIVVAITKEFCEYVEDKIQSIKYKHRMKHRFDGPPLAECYCHDCKTWYERDDDSMIGKCIGFANKYTAADCFCKYAKPRKTDPDMEKS